MKSSTTTLAVASSLLLSAAAQSQYYINPTSVSNATKSFWCQQQISECPLICVQTPAQSAETLQNTCDPASLSYACVCSNGQSPNVTDFSQTLPFFICQEWGNQCVNACSTTDTSCQSACRQDHPCGAQNPTRVNTSTIVRAQTTAGGAGQTGGATTTGVVYSGFGGGAASATAGGAASGLSVHAAALNAGRTFGVLGVFGLMFGGFAVLL